MRRISFLVPDIGSPTVGAALKLAACLNGHFQTEIVGPDYGSGVCSLYRAAHACTPVPAHRLYRFPDYFWERRRLEDAVTGDVIIAVKAFADTIPVALRVKRRNGVPVLVYLDEWDGALWAQKTLWERLTCWMRHAHHPMEDWSFPFIERMISKADKILSTTTFLQRRFGGDILHAGVDTNFFAPQPPSDVAALRDRYGLRHCRVIVFGGVVRPHKGVEEILEALCCLGDARYRLLVAGPVTHHLEALMSVTAYHPYIAVAGAPLHDPSGINAEVHERIPLYLDMGDLVAIPLRNTLLAQSQMPIKIFEAMAMAKPIIASAVSDLPLILDGCGRIVPPGDVNALAEAIREVFDDPESAKAMGDAAREKCIRHYSKEVTERTLVEVVKEVLGP